MKFILSDYLCSHLTIKRRSLIISEINIRQYIFGQKSLLLCEFRWIKMGKSGGKDAPHLHLLALSPFQIFPNQNYNYL